MEKKKKAKRTLSSLLSAWGDEDFHTVTEMGF